MATITSKNPPTNMIRDFVPQPTESRDNSVSIDISNDEESGGQIPPEVNSIVSRQSSDLTNNNAGKTSSDEIQTLTNGSTGSGTEEEKQKFDKYVGEYTPVIAISFVGTSVILLINHMTMADKCLNFVLCCTGFSLLFLCLIKLPNPRTAWYQFNLIVLGVLLIISSVAIRTFVGFGPEISKQRTILVISVMIGCTGCFAGYVWSAVRQTEDNRQSSVNR